MRELVFRNLAAFQRALKVARDPSLGGFGSLWRHLQHGHRQTTQQRGRCNSGAHGSTADHTNIVDLTRHHTFQLRQLANCPLAKERMDQALPLIRIHQLEKQFTLALHPRVKRHFGSSLHTANSNGGRQLPARFFQDRGVNRVEVHTIGIGHFADRAAFHAAVDKLPRIGQTNVARRPVFDAVDDPQIQRFFRANLAARCDHLDRLLYTDQPGQPLRATRTGHHTDQNFGQTNTRLWNGNAIMRTQRNFQTATQSCAVQGRHHEQWRAFQPHAHIRQPWLQRRFAEFLDIGARKIGGPFAIDENRLGAVSFGPFDPVDQPLTHSLS